MKVSIDRAACLFAALLLMTLPLNWLFACFFAAAFHEVCHAVVIRLVGGRIYEMRLGAFGAAIEMQPMSTARELVCAAAGPAGSLLLISLCPVFPRLAICAAIQGIFNLLPLYPLDGGRVLHCLFAFLLPGRENKILRFVEIGITAVILLVLLTANILFELGMLPLIAAILVMIRFVMRKRPCKERRIGVQ